MKMKEIMFQNRLWTAAAMGSHNKPIRQALEEVNMFIVFFQIKLAAAFL